MNLINGVGTINHKSGSLRYTLHKKASETLEKLLYRIVFDYVEKVFRLPLYVQMM